jgi:hypothetical protein
MMQSTLDFQMIEDGQDKRYIFRHSIRYGNQFKLNYPGEPLKGADKTVSRLKAAGFLLLPPRRGN